MKILVVVDMQHDFIDGSLGSQEANAIVPFVTEKIRQWNGPVFATRDTHPTNYLETQEGQKLPVIHCIKGTPGWEINPVVENALKEKNAKVIDKPSFGSFTLTEEVKALNPDEIELVGLCTDICVVSNALLLKAALPEVPMSVDATCCAGVTPEKHQAALETMASCQIEIKR